MGNKVYFNRPGKESEIYYRIQKELESAQDRILVAMAFFSDEELRNTIINNTNVDDKRIILNNSDLLRDYKEDSLKPSLKWAQEESYIVSLGTFTKDYPSNMHHKFLIIDNCIWVGSYNFTTYAKDKNWESMVRIEDDDELLSEFLNEFNRMYKLGMAFSTLGDQLNKDRCKTCNSSIDNPFNHYQISAETVNIISLRYGNRGNGCEEYLYETYTLFNINCQKEVTVFPDTDCSKCNEPFSGKDLTKLTINNIYDNPENSAMHYDLYVPAHHQDSTSEKYYCTKCFASIMESEIIAERRKEQLEDEWIEKTLKENKSN